MQVSLRIAVCLFFGCFNTWAQNLPVYTSYYANPFLYNPAAVASETTNLFIHHRQQWMGIEGAPVLSAFSINSLLDNSRSGLGFKVSSFQRGLLSTSDVSFAYAYGIPVSKKNHLFFGMSVGAITNTVDVINATDPSDPVFADYQANNLQAAGSFGLLYQAASGLNFGFMLPQLFAPTFLDPSFAEIKPLPFDNMVASIGYRKSLEGKMITKKVRGMKTRAKATADVFAPLELYLLYRYSAFSTNQFEAMAKFNLSQSFWLGASYRQAYGAIASTGFNIKRLSLGYSFELGGQPEAGFSQGTHEVFVSLRVGDRKKFKKTAPLLRSTLTAPTGPQHHARFQHQADDPEHILEAGKKEPKKRYYVVVRSFADFTAADVYKKKLIGEKYNAEVFYFAKDKRYHVHIFNTFKSPEAYEEVRNLKNYTKIKDARVLVVDEK